MSWPHHGYAYDASAAFSCSTLPGRGARARAHRGRACADRVHPGASSTVSVVAPPASSSARYHVSVSRSRPSNPAHPQITLSVAVVVGPVFVRCASRTAFAHGPSASKREGSPARSISCPDALKTYDAPAAATATRNGGRARSRSTTLIGSPLCSDAALQASTATLIGASEPP